MALHVVITQNYDAMTNYASVILLSAMGERTKNEKKPFNLGLATGSTQHGLYERIVDKQNEFDARLVSTWNLDEYIGFSGVSVAQRRDHPQGYTHFMNDVLFSHLNPSLAATHMPPGYAPLPDVLREAIEGSLLRGETTALGENKGQAFDISHTSNGYLRYVQGIMDEYIKSIGRAGGIDYWVTGVGRGGHLGFHESGIPFNQHMFVVKLDPQTIHDAVTDGHFQSFEKAPHYALTMSASGIVSFSKNIITLASGERKTYSVAKALLDSATPQVPLSILQHFRDREGTAYLVLDESAARGIFGKEETLRSRGIKVFDIRP